MVGMAVFFVWWRGGFGALFLGIGWAWVVDFAAGFRRCPAGVLFLTAKKSSQKKAGPHPRPCGLPCAAQPSGAAAELGPCGTSDSPRRKPPARLALLGGGGRGRKTGGVANAVTSVGVGGSVAWDMLLATFCCGVGWLAGGNFEAVRFHGFLVRPVNGRFAESVAGQSIRLSGVPGYWTVPFLLDTFVVYY